MNYFYLNYFAYSFYDYNFLLLLLSLPSILLLQFLYHCHYFYYYNFYYHYYYWDFLISNSYCCHFYHFNLHHCKYQIFLNTNYDPYTLLNITPEEYVEQCKTCRLEHFTNNVNGQLTDFSHWLVSNKVLFRVLGRVLNTPQAIHSEISFVQLMIETKQHNFGVFIGNFEQCFLYDSCENFLFEVTHFLFCS